MWGSALWFKGSRQKRHGNREGAAVSNRTSKASLARSLNSRIQNPHFQSYTTREQQVRMSDGEKTRSSRVRFTARCQPARLWRKHQASPSVDFDAAVTNAQACSNCAWRPMINRDLFFVDAVPSCRANTTSMLTYFSPDSAAYQELDRAYSIRHHARVFAVCTRAAS